MRPLSIVRFERLYILKILVGIVVAAWTWSALSTLVAPADAPPQIRSWMPYMTVLSVLVQVAISLLLLYFIARRRSEIAKWIFVALFVIGAAGVLRGYLHPNHLIFLPPPLKAAGLLEILIEVAMMILLFRPDAKAWFLR